MGRLANSSSANYGSGTPVMSPPPKPAPKPAPSAPATFKPCDECGYAHDGTPISQAKHQVDVPGGTLYFCNHHFKDHSLTFIAARYRCIKL